MSLKTIRLIVNTFHITKTLEVWCLHAHLATHAQVKKKKFQARDEINDNTLKC